MAEKTKSEKLYELRKWVKTLSKYAGSGTQLISVYIPAGSPVHEMSNKLREEMSQASNIKSKQTRTNVLGALERIINYIKMFRQTPPNGIAVFAGNISDNPAKTDIQLFSLEPPEPLRIGTYRCDSRFYLEPLQNMMETKEAYGILVLDGRDATLAIVKGTEIKVVDKLHSMAHAKIRKGGQSAMRYQRLIEESIDKYYQRVSTAMDNHYLGKVKGVIVGGPGPTKDFFLKAKHYNYQINVLGVVDTGYTDEYGVREVLEKSDKILAEQEAVKEKTLVDRFVKEVVSDGLATYGEKQVREAIVNKQAEKVLLSEGLEYVAATYKCPSCNAVERKITRDKAEERIPCPKCNAEMRLEIEKPLLDDLEELARENDIEVEIISTDTTEGMQFFTGFGGIGALLRYKIR